MLQEEFFTRENRQLAYFNKYTGHISNPGMGIVAMLLSDHMWNIFDTKAWEERRVIPTYYPTDEEMSRVVECPYIDQLYIRVGWNEVQKQRGKLELSDNVKRALECIRESGKTWGLRIMQCSPTENSMECMLPQFLADKLPMIYLKQKGRNGDFIQMPIYSEEYFLYWDEMLHLLGNEFDNDASLELMDVSGFGFWGEGHHCGVSIEKQDVGIGFGTKEEHELAVKRLIESQLLAFPKTPMSLNLHLCDYEAGKNALKNGSWCRRDSYYEYFKSYEAQYGLMRRGDSAMTFETIMPSHKIPIRTQESTNSFRSWTELPALECDFGCNYAVVGFNPNDVIFVWGNQRKVFEDLEKRIGYRIRPSIVWESVSNDGTRHLTLGMVNDGCANVPGDVEIIAECRNERSSVIINGGELCGRMKIVDIEISTGFKGKCRISAALKTAKGSRPIRWASDCADGKAPYELTIEI